MRSHSPMSSTLGVWALAIALLSCAQDPAQEWADLDRAERLEYMMEVVEPTMEEIFQERDPQAWANFSCITCHGPDMVARDYAMPNALFALPLDGTLEAAEAHDPDVTDFMLEEVFPVFVELLGETRYNGETNPDGYRCVGCHAIE